MALRTLSPLLMLLGLAAPAGAADFTKIPAPAVDQSAADATSETIVLAGGCFWGVQGVFQHVKGVTRAVSGYAGGMMSTAAYEKVNIGNTGHAELVQVTYDPKQISYLQILQIYFTVAHDPTQKNRQGPDIGTQYRSAIFPVNDQQAGVAKAFIDQLSQAKVYKAPVVTKLERGRAFYPAEKYHQDYMTLHPRDQYIVHHDIPKVQALQKMYPTLYRDDPVLVSQTGIKPQD